MRVNVYAEEMTARIQIISKEIEGQTFTGLRIYLELPASYHESPEGDLQPVSINDKHQAQHWRGPFIHHPGDDDTSAVTFWGKQDLRNVLWKAIRRLDEHYAKRKTFAEKLTERTIQILKQDELDAGKHD